MMKNKLLILLSIFFLVFFVGLLSCNDNCPASPNKFKVVGLDWDNFSASYSATSNPKLTLSNIENDTVEYPLYSIYIRPIQETYFAHHVEHGSFSFVQTAYACSPRIPETDEKIDSVIIVATKAFDIDHPAGSDLSDLFDVVVLDYPNVIYHIKYDLKDYLNGNPEAPGELTLILREPPDTTTDFEFLVKYYQYGIDNNDHFEFTTSKIVIRKN